MKAEVTINELRVGNLVHLIANGHENEPDLVKWIVDDFEFYENRMKDIQPIPLTEEWLKMFGANCIGAKGWNFISVNKADTSYIYFNPNGIGLAIDNGTTENAIEVEIKYVHQLQNLYFALTNTELTIKTK